MSSPHPLFGIREQASDLVRSSSRSRQGIDCGWTGSPSAGERGGVADRSQQAAERGEEQDGGRYGSSCDEPFGVESDTASLINRLA
jgi:hypothetical protein